MQNSSRRPIIRVLDKAIISTKGDPYQGQTVVVIAERELEFRRKPDVPAFKVRMLKVPDDEWDRPLPNPGDVAPYTLHGDDLTPVPRPK